MQTRPVVRQLENWQELEALCSQDLLQSYSVSLLRPPAGSTNLSRLPPELLNMIAAYLDMRDLVRLRRTSVYIGKSLEYALANLYPRSRYYRYCRIRRVTRVCNCPSLRLRRTLVEILIYSNRSSRKVEACIMRADFPNLTVLDLQSVRFTQKSNIIRLLKAHSSSLVRLRLCFVDLQ